MWALPVLAADRIEVGPFDAMPPWFGFIIAGMGALGAFTGLLIKMNAMANKHPPEVIRLPALLVVTHMVTSIFAGSLAFSWGMHQQMAYWYLAIFVGIASWLNVAFIDMLAKRFEK